MVALFEVENSKDEDYISKQNFPSKVCLSGSIFLSVIALWRKSNFFFCYYCRNGTKLGRVKFVANEKSG